MFYKIKTLLFLSLFASIIYASQSINTPDGYTLDAQLTKTSILLGETTQLTLTFRYKEIEDYEIEEPEFSGLIVKELDSKDYRDKDGYNVEEVHYSLKPLSEGNFSLSNLHVLAQIIDGAYKNFDNRSKYTKKFSVKAETITLEVKKLPANITAIGEYRLKTTVDKTHVKKGEVITLTISLYGEGNIQNLDAIELNIPDATSYLIYTTQSQRLHLQTKVYEVISEKPFVIPSFELNYFHKRMMKTIQTKTDPIKITIQNYIENYILEQYVFIFFLSIVALIISYIIFQKFKIKRESTLIKKVKSCRSKDDLYKVVVIFLGRGSVLDSLIYQLEGEYVPNFKVIKKEIIKELVKLGLNERNDLLFTTKNTL